MLGEHRAAGGEAGRQRRAARARARGTAGRSAAGGAACRGRLVCAHVRASVATSRLGVVRVCRGAGSGGAQCAARRAGRGGERRWGGTWAPSEWVRAAWCGRRGHARARPGSRGVAWTRTRKQSAGRAVHARGGRREREKRRKKKKEKRKRKKKREKKKEGERRKRKREGRDSRRGPRPVAHASRSRTRAGRA